MIDKNIIRGNMSNFAIRVTLEKKEKDILMGNVFIFVNGRRFGGDQFSYDVVHSLDNVLKYVEIVLQHDFDRLIECPPEEIYSSFEVFNDRFSLYDEEEALELSPLDVSCDADIYYPDFVKNYLKKNLDDCIFRLGNYAFTEDLILLVPNHTDVLICAKHLGGGGDSESSALLEKGEFLKYWKELSEEVRSIEEM